MMLIVLRVSQAQHKGFPVCNTLMKELAILVGGGAAGDAVVVAMNSERIVYRLGSSLDNVNPLASRR